MWINFCQNQQLSSPPLSSGTPISSLKKEPPDPARSTRSQIPESDLWQDLSWHMTTGGCLKQVFQEKESLADGCVQKRPSTHSKSASQTSPPHQTQYQTPRVDSLHNKCLAILITYHYRLEECSPMVLQNTAKCCLNHLSSFQCLKATLAFDRRKSSSSGL